MKLFELGLRLHRGKLSRTFFDPSVSSISRTSTVNEPYLVDWFVVALISVIEILMLR